MVNLNEYGIDVGLLVSGLFGAILLTSKDSARSYGKTISSLVGGAAAANYIAPVIVGITKLNGMHVEYSIGFILGFTGLKSVEYVCNKLLPNPTSIHPHEEHNIPAEEPATEPKPVRSRRKRKTSKTS